MHSALLTPFRLLREGKNILQLKNAVPSVSALFRCWLSLRLAGWGCRTKPFFVRFGSLTLHAHTREELGYLFGEVFLGQEYFAELPAERPRIIDCGANIGFATVYFKLRHPKARLTSFEPNPSCFGLLEKNVEGNGLEDVTLVPAACGRENGTVSFFMDEGFSPMSSVHAGRVRGGTACEVRQVRASDYIATDVDLFKLDVEGAEWGILEDLIASGKISRIRRLIIEYHHRFDSARAEAGRFLQMLETAGFTCMVSALVTPKRYFGESFQDVLVYARNLKLEPALEAGKTSLRIERPARTSWFALPRPLQIIMEARRILRMENARPGPLALLNCWNDLQCADAESRKAEPFVTRIGPLEITAPSYDDCRSLFENIFLNRVYETRLGRHDPFILDCGGGAGLATVYFKLHYPASRVVTFEPDPHAFALLQKNIESNGFNGATLVNAGCGRENGEIPCFISSRHSMPGSAQVRSSEDSISCAVRQVRLSGYIDREVDLLRLAIGGAEWEVIEDLIASGKIKSVKRMIIEYHHRMDSLDSKIGRFLRLLEDAGLTYDLLASVAPERRFGDKWQMVTIFASWPQIQAG